MSRTAEAVWSRVVPNSPVFTTSEVASQADTSIDVASRDLAVMRRQGLIVRISTGVWAYNHDPRFSVYAVVPALVSLSGPRSVGYVSLLSALNLHGMISQIPRSVHVVCSHRRARVKRTSVGTYAFYMMQPSLVGGFERHSNGTFQLARPEKALFDLLFYSTRRGTRFAHTSGISLPRAFSFTELNEWIERVRPSGLRVGVRRRWQVLQQRLEH